MIKPPAAKPEVRKAALLRYGRGRRVHCAVCWAASCSTQKVLCSVDKGISQYYVRYALRQIGVVFISIIHTLLIERHTNMLSFLVKDGDHMRLPIMVPPGVFSSLTKGSHFSFIGKMPPLCGA